MDRHFHVLTSDLNLLGLPFATVRRVMPGQISMAGFSRFIFRIFTVAAAVSAAELKRLAARMFTLLL